MLTRFKVFKFWIIAFSVIMWNVLKGNHWNMAYIDFHLGDDTNGNPIRKQLVARRSCNSLDIYWQEVK